MPNVLRMPRPAGSGRPNKGRKLISVWVAEAGIEHLDQLAKEFGVSRSDLIRDALKAGLPVVERQLKRGR